MESVNVVTRREGGERTRRELGVGGGVADADSKVRAIQMLRDQRLRGVPEASLGVSAAT